jgi:hypothetical protein
MEQQTLISDVNEAVTIIETYNLSALVWKFNDCPLSELKHYVSNGKEELVIVAHKEDKYIPARLVFDPMNQDVDYDASRIMLDFHSEYYIYIVLNYIDDED